MRQTAHRGGRLGLAALLFSGLLAAAFGIGPTAAQGGDMGWSSPSPVSQAEWAWFPVATVDAHGRVHVLWAETAGDNASVPRTDALVYSSWNDGAWSAPVDVLVSPDGGFVQAPAVAADGSGYLHVVWNDGARFWYSRAAISEAGRSPGWRSPMSLGGGSYGSADVVPEGTSRLHVAYADPAAGIFYTSSEDSGDTWSSASTVFRVTGASEGVASPRLAVGADGSLHVVWTGIPLPDGYPPLGVLYTRSTDGGLTWSEPVQIAGEDYGEPNILTTANDAVHLVWHGRAGVGGTFYRTSADGGATWTVPLQLLEGSGLTRAPDLAVDSAGTLHLAGISSDGLAYTFLEEDRWADPVVLDRTAVGYEPHYPTLAVSGGDEMFVFWGSQGDGEGVGVIRYARRQTSAPYVAPVPVNTAAPIAGVEGSPTAVLPQRTLAEATTPAAKPSPTAAVLASQSPAGVSGVPPLAAGIVGALVVLAVAAVVWLGRR